MAAGTFAPVLESILEFGPPHRQSSLLKFKFTANIYSR
jgi:hypothetical protein